MFGTLVGEVGETIVRDVERQITLCQIDRCWSEHLSQVTGDILQRFLRGLKRLVKEEP